MSARGTGALLALALLLPAGAFGAFPQDPPNDPLFDASPLPNATNEQWDLASPGGGFDRGISVDRAWPITTGAGAVVADIDVGVQLDHPDLLGRWFEISGEVPGNGVDDDGNGYVDDRTGYDFYARDGDASTDTRNAHGTNVAGVLGASADNGIGIAGIAPSARIMPLRTADNILHQGRRLAESLVYAADNGADVASMSLGADSFSLSLRRAASYAERRGVVIVVAIGNEFHFHQHQPQALDEAIAVGGLNPDSADLTARDNRLALVGTNFRLRAQYSDYGPHIDLVAPTQVPTTEFGGGTRLGWDGTSAATPHVSGVATLVVARGRELGLGLSALEVVQLLRTTADDLTQFGRGWDRLTGWGRVNAYEAVRRVGRTRIPPATDIDKPDWYRPARGVIPVTGRVHGRSPSRWELELGRGEEPTRWRPLAEGVGTGARPRTLHRLDTAELAAGGWTLRLRSRDAHGNEGVDRAFFRVLNDRALRPGFPRALGTSGEAAPALADLDGDGAQEVVLATSDGLVRVYRGTRQLRGWPRAMRPAAGAGPAGRRIGGLRSGFLATPAVGDVTGDRRPDVVAAGLDGRVYAWSARGRPLRGFPVAIDADRPLGDGRRDAAIYASPSLADLDGDGHLDIVVGAADQHIYAWRGDGSRLPGWPVLARDPDGGDMTKILSSPAVGDLNGDGSPDVVEGTAEAYGSTPLTTGRVHAWNGAANPFPAGRSSRPASPPTRSRSPARASPARPRSPTWTATAATRLRSPPSPASLSSTTATGGACAERSSRATSMSSGAAAARAPTLPRRSPSARATSSGAPARAARCASSAAWWTAASRSPRACPRRTSSSSISSAAGTSRAAPGCRGSRRRSRAGRSSRRQP